MEQKTPNAQILVLKATLWTKKPGLPGGVADPQGGTIHKIGQYLPIPAEILPHHFFIIILIIFYFVKR